MTMLKFLGASTRLRSGRGMAGKGLRGEEWTRGAERRTWWAAFLGPGAGRHPREPAVALRIRGQENPVLGPEFWGAEEGF